MIEAMKRKWTYLRIISAVLVFSLLLTSLPFSSLRARGQAADVESAGISVIEEIEELRDEFSKTFLMSDGTYRAVVAALPLHYLEKDKDEDMRWENIDNSLSLVTNEKGQREYKNTKASFDARLPEMLGENRALSISKDGFTLSMEMLNVQSKVAAKQAAEKFDSKSILEYANKTQKIDGLSYENAMPSVTVNQSILPIGIKECIVLQKNPDVTVYQYRLAADGLRAFLNEDNTIDFYKSDKTPVKDVEKKTATETTVSKQVENPTSTTSAPIVSTVPSSTTTTEETSSENTASGAETTGEASSTQSEVSLPTGDAAKSAESSTNDIVVPTDVDPTAEYQASDTKNEEAKPEKPDGDPIFHMPAPFMFDSASVHSTDIKVILTATDGGWLLTYTPDAKWLGDEGRKWPVTIDPSVQTGRSYSNIYDTYVQTDSWSNYGTSTLLRVGHTSDTVYQKTFVRIGSLATLPEGSIVTKADFKMYRNSSYNTAAAFRTGIYKITSSWSETALNCTNMPSYDPMILDWAFHDNNTDGYVNWDITGLVSDWYSGAASNYGVMVALHDVDSNIYASQVFFSCDNTSLTSQMPYIEISYESSIASAAQSTRQMDVGRAGTVSINDFTGGLTLDRSDISIDGNVMPVEIRMIYNSAERNKAVIGSSTQCGDFGAGFRSNYSQTLKYMNNGRPSSGDPNTSNPNAKDWFEYTTEDGSVIYFERAIENADTTAETERTEIFTTGDDRGYKLYVPSRASTDNTRPADTTTGLAYIIDGSGHRYYFDNLYRLTKIAGNMPQTDSVTATSNISGSSYTHEPGVIKIMYTNTGGHANTLQINYILDGAGRKYQFNYNASYKLTSIQYLGSGSTALQTVTYNIDASLGILSSVTYPGSRTVSYLWSGTALTEVKNSDNYKVNFTYTGSTAYYKVYTIREYGTNSTLGQSVNVTYGKYQTTYTDNLTGEKEILQFDSRGNVICIQDGNGNAHFGKYESAPESSKQPNRLVFTSGLQRTSVNLVKNPIAADSFNWSGTANRVTDHKMYGTYSFKLTAANSSLTQSVPLASGKTYTLSAWVKTENIGSGGSATVSVSGTGITTTKAATTLTGTNDWTRIYAVFTASSTSASIKLSLDGAAGNVWFDGIQVEYGSVMRRFTLVQNGGFENGLTNWTSYTSSVGSTYGNYNYVSSTATPPNVGNNYAILYGDPRYSNEVRQEIPVSGVSGDSFTCGAWVKSNAVPIRDDRKAGVKLEFINSSGSVITDGATEISVNPFVADWQYIMGEATAPGNYSSVRITMMYTRQCNTAQFDGVQVYKEPFGAWYTYDASGNLIGQHEVQNGQNDTQSSYIPAPKQYTEVMSTYYTNTNIISHLSGRNAEGMSIAGSVSTNPYTGTSNNFLVIYRIPIDNRPVPSVIQWEGCKDVSDNVVLLFTGGAWTQIGTVTTSDWGTIHRWTLTEQQRSGITSDNLHIAFFSVKTGTWAGIYNKNTTPFTFEYAEAIETAESLEKGKTTEDKYGRIVQSISDEGVGTTYNYDAFNNPMVERITNGRVSIETTNTYTSNGNYQTSSKDPFGNETIYNFDTMLGRINTVTDSRNTTTTYGYDAIGLLSSISQPSSGGTMSNAYAYDSGDRLTSITRNGFSYNFGYDAFGVLNNIKVGMQNLVTYNHNSIANGYTLASTVYGNGQTVSYRYDANKVLAGVSYGGSERYTYFVDDDGEVHSVIDNSTGLRTDFSLDSDENRVTIRKDIIGSSFQTQKFWETENAFTDVIGSTTRTTGFVTDRDRRNNGSNWITGEKKNHIEIYWDDLGRMTGNNLYTQQGGNATYLLNTSYAYNDVPGYKTSDQVYSMNFRGAAYNKSLNYEYGADGNITKAGDISYTYDAAGQLKTVTAPVRGTTTYNYDAGGNITTVVNGGTTKTYTYGNANWKDLLTNYNGTAINYDAIGNPLNWHSGVSSMTWEMGRELASLTKSGVAHSFTYNEVGLRTSKTFNSVTTRYYWADNKMTAQEDGTDFIYFRYDSDDKLVAFELNGVEYYYIKNLQGDVIAILDSDGNCVVEYEYDAWGKLLATTGSLASTVGLKNPMRYRCYYYDSSTGWYYLESRYFDSEIGRFINADAPELMTLQPENLLSTNLFIY